MDVHPLYKIAAVLIVGSVAKALFAPDYHPAAGVTTVARQVGDVAVDKLTDTPGKH